MNFEQLHGPNLAFCPVWKATSSCCSTQKKLLSRLISLICIFYHLKELQVMLSLWTQCMCVLFPSSAQGADNRFFQSLKNWKCISFCYLQFWLQFHSLIFVTRFEFLGTKGLCLAKFLWYQLSPPFPGESQGFSSIPRSCFPAVHRKDRLKSWTHEFPSALHDWGAVLAGSWVHYIPFSFQPYVLPPTGASEETVLIGKHSKPPRNQVRVSESKESLEI